MNVPYLKDPRKGDRHRSKKDRHRAGYRARLRGRREFVAVDGEGAYAEGDPHQRYVLLADSTGRSLWRDEGLSTRECLDFLLRAAKGADPNVRRVLVGFGLSYDVEFWLRDLSAAKWARLFGPYHDCLWGPYRIRYLKGKWFEVWRIEGERAYARVDDTRSLFGGTFLSAAREWLGDAASPILAEGKERRVRFSLADRAFMEEYNAEENRLMVAIMLRFQAALDSLGARPAHYSSPAILGKWFLTQHDSKRFVPKPEDEPAEFADLYRRAYFGGRIEMAGVGRTGPVLNLDLNSAYPAAVARLPNLANGRWVRQVPLLGEVGMVRLRWDFRKVPRRFYPLPFRDRHGRVYFPPCGTGWVWEEEWRAALLYGDFPYDSIQVLDGWAFEPKDSTERPFAWVEGLYAQRAELKARGDPAHYPLKIAYNSIYGSFAQELSLDPNHKPAYSHMGYAGLITAYTRAALYALIRFCEEATVAVATDGIYWGARPEALVPERKLPSSSALGMGKTEVYADMVSLQSGVYRLLDRSGEWSSFGRGYGGARVPWEDVERAWHEHRESVPYMGRDRFVGHRLAAARHKPETWGEWEPVPRTIKLNSAGTKRNPLPRADLIDPSRGVVWTRPNSLFTPEDESQPYTFNKDRAKAEMDSSVEVEMEDETASETTFAAAGRKRHPLPNCS